MENSPEDLELGQVLSAVRASNVRNRYTGVGLVVGVVLICIAVTTVAQEIRSNYLSALEHLRRETLEIRQEIREKRPEPAPVGSVIPYFGRVEDIPSGWALCDGRQIDSSSGFEASEYEASVFWGKNVPDLRGVMMGGAVDETEVGNVWDRGRIRIDPYTLAGNQFRLDKRRNDTWDLTLDSASDPGPVALESRNAKDIRVRFERGEMLTGISGEARVPEVNVKLDSRSTLPIHVMCRFLIRIK